MVRSDTVVGTPDYISPEVRKIANKIADFKSSPNLKNEGYFYTRFSHPKMVEATMAVNVTGGV